MNTTDYLTIYSCLIVSQVWAANKEYATGLVWIGIAAIYLAVLVYKYRRSK